MDPKHEFHVISNTHWDREWRFPFERTRAMLVEMMDRLLDLLDRGKGFKYFHLDAHTIMLEDYLEVRPEKLAALKRHVAARRLLVGPWYTLPDACSCSGEALVRNLLRGTRMARDFGHVMEVGYTPNGFGQPSQLPQLYAGFGIDTVMFYRGVPRQDVKSEFIWQGPDGTRALAFRFGKYARYNFFFLVYRPVVHGRRAFECEYRWPEGALPFRLDRELSYEPYYLLDFQPLFAADRIVPGLEEVAATDAATMTTPVVIAMQGCDSTAPDDTEARIVAEANRLLGAEKVFHSALEDVVARVRQQLPADLQVAHGEMRHTLHSDGQTNLYPAIYGCRVYLRQANAFSEANLENWAEPAACMAWLLGEEYPHGLLRLAWKLLLENHAHDSIGGCAMDRVHEDVMNRFARCDDITHEVTRSSLAKVVRHLDTSRLPGDTVLLVAFNCLPHRNGGVIRAAVDLPLATAGEDLTIETLAGQAVPHQLVAMQDLRPTVQKPNDIPSPFHARRFLLHLDLPPQAGMGWTTLRVRPAAPAAARAQKIGVRRNALENEFMRVTAHPDGTLDLLDKDSGHTFPGLHAFESDGETGDPWNRMTPTTDCTYSSRGGKARLAMLDNGPLAASLEITLALKLPEGVLPDRSARSDTLVPCPIRTVLTLRRGCRWLDMHTVVNNTVRDHRLRLLLPTALKAKYSWGHMPFDVVKRPVHVPGGEGWLEPPTGAHPQKLFVDVSDGRTGLAVLNRGITQYEVLDTPERPVALTLMRCFQMRNTVQNLDYPDQPGTQCQGRQEFRYALLPHRGDWDAGGVMAEAARWNVPPVICQVGVGRGHLPPETTLFSVADETLAFSGIKPAEDGAGLILRLYNPSERTVACELRAGHPVAWAESVRLDEKPLAAATVSKDGRLVSAGQVGPKKVISLRLRMAQ
ncbi:MAG: Mannosylglycerate hydrolase [Lentisphaerae bacterium ADurb.BinA184]|nr:MAG: Mannosylglycerate hydrolase [Lentisphaerae bacterium ADurb.BinA184]